MQKVTWLTVEKLQEVRLNSRMTPLEARTRLEKLQGLFESLLTTKSDVQRIRLVAQIKRRLVLGFRELEDLAILSKIAGEPQPK